MKPPRRSIDPEAGPALDAAWLARLDAASVEPAGGDAAASASPEAAAGAGPDADAGRERVRRRLLRRVAADTTERHLTLPAEGPGWQPFGEGLAIKVLHEAAGVMSYLLRLAAGAALPAHRHPHDEECVVLEGVVHIGALRLGPGGYHLARKDVLHDRLHSPEGALVFLRGAVPEAAHLV
jgi:quercetin dioxygenase-like cupin family protein